MTTDSTLEKKAKEAGYKYLGWENGWSELMSGEYCKCRGRKHPLEIDSHGIFGTDHTYVCHNCKIYWKLDSGD